jgi:hypothetical protein
MNTAIIDMPKVTDPLRGCLTYGGVDQGLPFVPKRYFLIHNVPPGQARGDHAHRECAQFLVCAHGSCRITVDDGLKRHDIPLHRPDCGVLVPPLTWVRVQMRSADSVLLVLASHRYEESDYIRDYSEFLQLVQPQQP